MWQNVSYKYKIKFEAQHTPPSQQQIQAPFRGLGANKQEINKTGCQELTRNKKQA
jgi:hypothetical protein